MRRFIKTCMFLLFFWPVFGQQKAVLFSEEIKKHISKYKQYSDRAYEKGDVKEGQRLFDSLVKNYLIGTKMGNYVLKSSSGKKVKLQKIKRPVLLITYSSWCVLNKAEIPALNKIAKKYENDFQMIVLFWDTKKNIKNLSNRFNNQIWVCYASEAYSADEQVVSHLKHYLGFPTSYFFNEHMEILDIQKGNPQVALKTPFKKALEFDMAFFHNRISGFLLQKDSRANAVVDRNP